MVHSGSHTPASPRLPAARQLLATAGCAWPRPARACPRPARACPRPARAGRESRDGERERSESVLLTKRKPSTADRRRSRRRRSVMWPKPGNRRWEEGGTGEREERKERREKESGSDALSVNVIVCKLYAKFVVKDLEALSLFYGVEKLFDEMPSRNVVSWSAMITAYAHGDCPSQALALFERMRRLDVKSNCATIVSFHSACSQMGALEQDMYAKCGCVDSANEVFDALVPKDVLSWTAMIGGLVVNEYAAKALELFDQMEMEGIKPNEVTFVVALCGCSHVGLVEKARNSNSVLAPFPFHRSVPEINTSSVYIFIYATYVIFHSCTTSTLQLS
ncbi:hypothetical protein ZIOFF_001645 [Zingiber officinale]|uniref:Pentatricopeptide repeat-containing protein n=1 Tax=Zingiber officinale TaxID=94328 RepID=A0A8J5HVP3_ZINOF|nr:hypothetical protein ZIOFF_001645 [Zingiber officinale]